MNETAEAGSQLAQYGDYMSALLISSAALLAILPIFLGFARQYRRETNKRPPALIVFSQSASFILGILAIMAILEWLFFKEFGGTIEQIAPIVPILLFGGQAMAFAIGTIPLFIELIGNGTEVTKMARVNKLEGVYLDSQFRRVEMYVCEKSLEPHKFDIPVDSNQRTKQEESWLKDLKNGKCPLC